MQENSSEQKQGVQRNWFKRTGCSFCCTICPLISFCLQGSTNRWMKSVFKDHCVKEVCVAMLWAGDGHPKAQRGNYLLEYLKHQQQSSNSGTSHPVCAHSQHEYISATLDIYSTGVCGWTGHPGISWDSRDRSASCHPEWKWGISAMHRITCTQMVPPPWSHAYSHTADLETLPY